MKQPIVKKQTVREIIELNKSKEKGASQKSDSLAIDSINNLNVIAQDTNHQSV
jgi:hypothetical protein